MSGLGTDFVLKHIPGATLPLTHPAPFYALVELATPRPDAGLRASLRAISRRGSELGGPGGTPAAPAPQAAEETRP